MRKATALLLFVALVLGWLHLESCYGVEAAGRPGEATMSAPTERTGCCSRIVSLAPSITEVLFALGLGDQVVGVTRYCKYPPEALRKEKVGGYLDLNYEAVVSMKPDLVVLLPEHDKARDHLATLGLSLVVVDHRSIEGILDSFKILAAMCGREGRGRMLVQEFEERMDRARVRAQGKPRPSVLLTVGREMGGGTLGQVYAAGTESFYNPLIGMAGGTNACRQGAVPFPALSAEGILRMNPDVIVELVPDLLEKGLKKESVLSDWKICLPQVNAVKTGRVHLFTEDYTVIPGPRIVLMVERLAQVLHPDGGE